MEGKEESEVEVSLPAQGAVMDVGLLLVVFVSIEPAERDRRRLTFRLRKREGILLLLPFDIDVAHPLPADADVIQDDVTGVPDDAAQKKPEEKHHKR